MEVGLEQGQRGRGFALQRKGGYSSLLSGCRSHHCLGATKDPGSPAPSTSCPSLSLSHNPILFH